MTVKVRYSDTCKIINERTGQSVDADVLSYNEKRNLTVSINKSIKVMLSWNGQIYEGRSAGMDFTSEGPRAERYKDSR